MRARRRLRCWNRRAGLQRISRLVQRLPPDVAVGLHHLGRHVTHLRLSHPVGQALLSQRRDGGMAAIMEADATEAPVELIDDAAARGSPDGLVGALPLG